MASTPALAITPDKTAEAGAGATGWAVGSQPCSGYMPAFAPKPTTPKKTTIRKSVSCPCTCAISRLPPGTNSRLVEYRERKKMHSSAKNAPATE